MYKRLSRLHRYGCFYELYFVNESLLASDSGCSLIFMAVALETRECLVGYFWNFTPPNQTSRVVTSFIVISHVSTGPYCIKLYRVSICISIGRFGMGLFRIVLGLDLYWSQSSGSDLYCTDLYCCRYLLKSFHRFFLLFDSPFFLIPLFQILKSAYSWVLLVRVKSLKICRFHYQIPDCIFFYLIFKGEGRK